MSQYLIKHVDVETATPWCGQSARYESMALNWGAVKSDCTPIPDKTTALQILADARAHWTKGRMVLVRLKEPYFVVRFDDSYLVSHEKADLIWFTSVRKMATRFLTHVAAIRARDERARFVDCPVEKYRIVRIVTKR